MNVFADDQFTPTKWSTAAEKASFANDLLALIMSGFPKAKFTQKLYQRLSNCFSHIADYVEGVIMRSASVNTLWIQGSTTSSLCIIPTIDLSEASQLPGGRSLYRKVKVCIPGARFESWRFGLIQNFSRLHRRFPILNSRTMRRTEVCKSPLCGGAA